MTKQLVDRAYDSAEQSDKPMYVEDPIDSSNNTSKAVSVSDGFDRILDAFDRASKRFSSRRMSITPAGAGFEGAAYAYPNDEFDDYPADDDWGRDEAMDVAPQLLRRRSSAYHEEQPRRYDRWDDPMWTRRSYEWENRAQVHRGSVPAVGPRPYNDIDRRRKTLY